MIFYKIQNAEGLFSTGGYYPSFDEEGKMWKSIGALKAHITMVMKRVSSLFENPYLNCRVVEFELLQLGHGTEVKDFHESNRKK